MEYFALITIGDELVKGELSNKNSILIAKILYNKGHKLNKIITVGDNKKEIIFSLQEVCSQFKNIIITGGLGPTQDDITREAIAEACDRELVYNDKIADNISNYFNDKLLEMTENNLRQAYFPAGAKIIENFKGTAPGFKLTWQNSLIYVLPGVTEEMTEMLKSELEGLENFSQNFHEYIFKVAGLGEAELEDRLKEVIENSQHKYRFLPRGGEIEIRISKNESENYNTSSDLSEELNDIENILGNNVFSKNEDKGLPETVKEKAIKREIDLSVAESCTGGLIGKRLTDVPGASEFFSGGIIAYNNDIKKNLLKVSAETIKNHGAVSRETAEEMAAGVNHLTKTEMSVSITGIAGPGGGTKEKPVGLVYFSLFHKGKFYTKKWNFSGGRRRVRWFASQYVLNKIRIYLLEELS